MNPAKLQEQAHGQIRRQTCSHTKQRVQQIETNTCLSQPRQRQWNTSACIILPLKYTHFTISKEIRNEINFFKNKVAANILIN